MSKSRIIIADTDADYIFPLQLKFAEEFFEKITLEIITDKDYFEKLFSTPQKADVLIVCEELYNSSLLKHNIENIFLMTEKYEEERTEQLNLNRIFKYTSIKEIFNEITGKLAYSFDGASGERKETQVILFCSAAGGTGKTTLSLGVSGALTKNYKKVLYINAERMQSFQKLLENSSPISSKDVYLTLNNDNPNIYDEIKHVIRKETFSYLPPFKTAIMSLGLEFSIYKKLIVSAKKSKEYDYIVVDTDSVFDDNKADLFEVSDKVIIVTKQNKTSVNATNILASNVNGISSEKYIFVCNDFKKEDDNALISTELKINFSVSDYIEHIDHCDDLKAESLCEYGCIQKTAFLVL